MINYKNATCWENVWGKLMFTLSGIWFSKITLFWTSDFLFNSFKIDSLCRKWKFVSKAGREMSFSQFSWRRNAETVFFVIFICLNDKPLVPYASFTLECSSEMFVLRKLWNPQASSHRSTDTLRSLKKTKRHIKSTHGYKVCDGSCRLYQSPEYWQHSPA